MQSGPSPIVTALSAALLLAAAAFNFALTPRHFAPHLLYGSVYSGSLAYGLFFLLAGVIQVLLATALLLRPGPRVFRFSAAVAAGLIAAWLVARATTAPLVPNPSNLSLAADALELAALASVLLGLPIGSGHSASAARGLAWGWGVAAGSAFAVLFLIASGSFAHVPFDLVKQGAVPWAKVDTSGGFGFLSPWIEVALSRHVILGGPWIVLAFAAAAGCLFALTTALAVALARSAGVSRPQSSGIAAAAPAFAAVPTCCGAALPLGATLGGSTLLPMISAAPWIMLASGVLMSANLAVLAHRWRSARRPESPPTATPSEEGRALPSRS